MGLLFYVTASVPHFIPMKVLGGAVPSFAGLFAGFGIFALVAVLRMVGGVYVAAEVGWAVKPWAGADENSAAKPLRAVVAVGSTGVGRGCIVTVGTGRGGTDANADLGL
jgi:hypothetical protein